MKAPQHTPGPWWVEDRRAKGGAIQVQARHRGKGSSYCVAEVNFHEQPEQNAALLAAAPDMFEALREAEEALGSWIEDTEPVCDDLDKMRSEFRAIIAKVEGK